MAVAATFETFAPSGLLNTWPPVARASAGVAAASNFSSCCTASGLVPVAAVALVMPELWPT